MRDMKKLKPRKRRMVLVLTSVAVLILCSIAATLAYYYVQHSVGNVFKTQTLNVNVHEEFTPPDKWSPNDVVTKRVSYQNVGTAKALLRVRVSESWIAADSTILSNEVEGVNLVKKNWNSENGLNTLKWTEQNGWYYYNLVLNPNESITIMESIQFEKPDTLPAEYTDAEYKLSFSHEFISVETEQALLWGADENTFKVNPNGSVTWAFKPIT